MTREAAHLSSSLQFGKPVVSGGETAGHGGSSPISAVLSSAMR